MLNRATTKANLMLLLITLMWGMTFPLIKEAIAHVSPDEFVLFRFTLAALFFLPFLFKNLRHTTRFLLLTGIVLALINCGIYLFQTIGLETISPSRSAFITACNVLFVPFFASMFGVGKIRIIDIISVVIALAGVYILTGANLSHLYVGDYYTLGCAILYAVAIVYIQWATPKMNNYILLSFYQILFALPFMLLLSMHNTLSGFSHLKAVIAILFCSIFATVIAFYLQMKYQKDTTATQAALIYCLEPVFATLFSVVISSEKITQQTIIGGGLILLAAAGPLLFKIRWRKKRVSNLCNATLRKDLF